MSLFHKVIVSVLALTMTVTLLVFVYMLTKPNPIHHWFQRRAIHKLLKVPLPQDAQDLHYAKFKISTFLAGYDAYIKFKTTRQSFFDLAQRGNFDLYKNTGPNNYLPAPWKQAPSIPIYLGGTLTWIRLLIPLPPLSVPTVGSSPNTKTAMPI